MHPLSIFPALLTFSMIAPLLLRVSISLFILNLGYSRYKKEYKWASVLYFASGVFVFLGLYTQIAVIVAIAILKFDLYVDFYKNRNLVPVPMDKYIIYGMAGIILLSLLFTGPGFFAFDLPL